jgi:UDP-2-acetamido-3-amino-2,3-dideoxy-glucuronate N-acetyltransferase
VRGRGNICLVGCGPWGRNLARNFSDLGALYALCEASPETLAGMRSQYPAARAYQTLASALLDPDIDAVALATPAEHHAPMALQALEAGKDVFVEKPLALDPADGHRMVEAAGRLGRVLMVGHLLKYHPAVVKLQQLVAAGALGPIEYIYSNRLSMGKIRREENALWSFAPHDISVILGLTGRLPVQVTATGGAYLQANVADVTVSTLLFSSGTRAHIFVSWLHPYKEQRLVVVGRKQMAVFEDTRADNKLLLFEKRIEWRNGVPEAGKVRGEPVVIEPVEPLRAECEHFLDCVRTRRVPRTPGEEGLEVLQVLEACQRSLQMNGQPVQIQSRAAPPLPRI